MTFGLFAICLTKNLNKVLQKTPKNYPSQASCQAFVNKKCKITPIDCRFVPSIAAQNFLVFCKMSFLTKFL